MPAYARVYEALDPYTLSGHSKAIELGDLTGAIEQLTKAAEFDPENAEIYRSRAAAYRG